jgi:SAM-dependent methyltransferase
MEEEEIRKFYKDLIDRYGMGPQVVGWGSSNSQNIRFKILLNVIKEKKGKVSLLDVGCGTCDLWAYIIKEYESSDLTIDYYGIYLSSDMICEARKKHCIDRHRITTSSLLKYKPGRKFDYVLASGIFSHANYSILKNNVLKMYSLSNKGFAFNCLKDVYKGVRRSEGEFYANSVYTQLLVRNIFDIDSVAVWTINDYLPNDFSILVRYRYD